jgi:urea transporter
MTTQSAMTSPEKIWDPVNFPRIVLRGVGQVMFQRNAITGLFFLAGVAVASPLWAVGSIIATVIATLFAYVMRFDRDEIRDGIYGFSPALVGIGILFHLKAQAPLTWILLILTTLAAVIVTYLARRYVPWLPTYTGPFIVTTWVALIIAPAVIQLPSPPPEHTPVSFVTELLRGEAEVFFGAKGLSGLLFVVGIAISNWRHAFLSILATFMATLLAFYIKEPTSAISIGLYGYNAALTGISTYMWRESLLIPILGGLLCVPVTQFFPHQPALTAPFVVATWIILAIGYLETLFLPKPANTEA